MGALRISIVAACLCFLAAPCAQADTVISMPPPPPPAEKAPPADTANAQTAAADVDPDVGQVAIARYGGYRQGVRNTYYRSTGPQYRRSYYSPYGYISGWGNYGYWPYGWSRSYIYVDCPDQSGGGSPSGTSRTIRHGSTRPTSSEHSFRKPPPSSLRRTLN